MLSFYSFLNVGFPRNFDSIQALFSSQVVSEVHPVLMEELGTMEQMVSMGMMG